MKGKRKKKVYKLHTKRKRTLLTSALSSCEASRFYRTNAARWLVDWGSVDCKADERTLG